MTRDYERDVRLVRFVQDYRDAHGYSPNYREMAEGLGFKSKAPIHHRVSRLVSEGLLETLPINSRNLVVTEEGRKCIR